MIGEFDEKTQSAFNSYYFEFSPAGENKTSGARYQKVFREPRFAYLVADNSYNFYNYTASF